jgi:hypothetical protein
MIQEPSVKRALRSRINTVLLALVIEPVHVGASLRVFIVFAFLRVALLDVFWIKEGSSVFYNVIALKNF